MWVALYWGSLEYSLAAGGVDMHTWAHWVLSEAGWVASGTQVSYYRAAGAARGAGECHWAGGLQHTEALLTTFLAYQPWLAGWLLLSQLLV
jgi:hypothetical protein